MRRSVSWAAMVLVVGSALFVPPSRAIAAWQRGPQNESRALVGRVISSQEEPVPKAVVYLKNTKNLLIKTYITDSDGSYRFTALAVNVDYEVYAEHQGLRSDTKTLSSFDSRKQANITLKLHSK